MANHEEVRWAALTTPDQSAGIVAIGGEPMSVTALPYDETALVKAQHPYQLPAAGATRLHLDLGQTGLGGTSCGQAPPTADHRIMSTPHAMSLVLRPVDALQDASSQARVIIDGDKPLRIWRDDLGNVTVSTPDAGKSIMVRIDGAKKPVAYTGPINMRNGGTIEAWLKDNSRISASASYGKIEKVPAQVMFVNSEEPYEEAKYAIDGDPDSYWHTMYSVTVAQYPHWIDLDVREVKNLTGVSYLPRQGGGENGDFKDYEVYVSTDGKNWGEPVAKGSFERNKKRKEIRFAAPVKGRYVRLRGLNSQNGQDYGAAAEIEVLADE